MFALGFKTQQLSAAAIRPGVNVRRRGASSTATRARAAAMHRPKSAAQQAPEIDEEWVLGPSTGTESG